MKDVCCIGSTIIDITSHAVDLEKLPSTHQRTETTLIGPGGCAGNVSINLVSLGKQVDLLARVGAGPMGQLLRQLLKSRGVQTSLLVNDPDVETGKAIVLVDASGQRRFIYTPGANANLSAGDLVPIHLNRYRIVHISDVFLLPEVEGPPLTNLLRAARIQGCKTSMDTIWDASGRWLETLAPYLPYLDYLFTSEEEAEHIYPNKSPEEVIDLFLDAGTKHVILKQGEKGSLLGFENQIIAIPPHEAPVVDTTGAGDAYVAAFLSGILEGYSPKEAAEGATVFAARSIGSIGATAGVKPHPSLGKFLLNN